MDAFHRQPYRLRLKDESVLEAALPGSSEAFRTLDAAAPRSAHPEGAARHEHRRHRRQARICPTAPSFDEAVARLEREEAQAAFFLRPTPVDQVRAVADAGETMPPKSTYFFPKLLTGLAFNPLSGDED